MIWLLLSDFLFFSIFTRIFFLVLDVFSEYLLRRVMKIISLKFAKQPMRKILLKMSKKYYLYDSQFVLAQFNFSCDYRINDTQVHKLAPFQYGDYLLI